LERKMERDNQRLEDYFKTNMEIIKKVHREKRDIEKEHYLMIEKYKELIRKLPGQAVATAVKNEAKETFDLIKAVASEGLVEENKKEIKKEKQINTKEIPEPEFKPKQASIDELFEMVVRNGKVKKSDAERAFGVHITQIDEWANILSNHELIEIDSNILRKKWD